LRGMKKRILRYKGVSVVFSLFLHFFFACSSVCADLLVSIITGGGHIRSNLRRLPSPQSYPSRSRSLGARTSCFTLTNIIYTLNALAYLRIVCLVLHQLSVNRYLNYQISSQNDLKSRTFRHGFCTSCAPSSMIFISCHNTTEIVILHRNNE